MPILIVLWKFKYWIAIAVLSFMWLGQIAYTNHLSGKLKDAEIACDGRVAKAIKPYQTAISKAEQQKAITEKAWSDKYIEVEQNAIKKIQDANAVCISLALNFEAWMSCSMLLYRTDKQSRYISHIQPAKLLHPATTC